MDVITGLREHLLGCAEIAALVVARVHTPILPAKCVYPAVQLQLISNVDRPHLRGPGLLPIDRIQIDCWATTRDGAVQLGRLCRERCNGYQGQWYGDGSPAPTLRVCSMLYGESSERFEEEILGGLCRHTADYLLTSRDSEARVLI